MLCAGNETQDLQADSPVVCVDFVHSSVLQRVMCHSVLSAGTVHVLYNTCTIQYMYCTVNGQYPLVGQNKI